MNYINKIPKIYLFFLITFYAIWIFYVCIINENIFDVLRHWQVALTMIFGSFVAGSSAAGGGSVAYPVLTLLLDIEPYNARNFSLAIQSAGMTAASLFIIGSKIKIDTNTIKYGSLGGMIGFLIGFNFLYGLVPSQNLKLIFTSIWMSFGFALWLLNRKKNRKIYSKLDELNYFDKIKLIGFGFLGGCTTSFFGSGIDIMVFCLLTLHFNLSEKVATPTSVILMTVNTLIGFFYHLLYIQDVETLTLYYFAAASPIVVLGAPLGAFVISKISRESINRFLYFILLLQFIGTIYVSKNELFLSTLFLIITVLSTSLMLFYFLIKTNKENSRI